MPSTSRCKYCNSTITSDDKFCPNCGGPNDLYVPKKTQTGEYKDPSNSGNRPKHRITHPRTIAELQEYCAERNMPLLRMRFFIGEDFKEPRAFGIYRDDSTGEYVVYKNKDSGERAIRYRGNDEAYAVNEIFQKLLSECHNRGIYPDGKPAGGGNRSVAKATNRKGIAFFVVFALFIITFMIMSIAEIASDYKHPSGYYNYGGDTFYYDSYDWYVYDNYYNDWYSADYGPYQNETSILYDSGKDYYEGDSWYSDYGYSDFRDSDAYYDSRQYDDSSSSYDDSSYDSWDSGSSDWSSDW